MKNHDFIEIYPDKFDLCDEVIQYFNNNKHLHQERPEEQKKMNISDTSMFLRPDVKKPETLKLLNEIDKILRECFELYKQKYSGSPALLEHDGILNYRIIEFKIQKTLPGQGFNFWHSERFYGGDPDYRLAYRRFLVYTIYLNDIEIDGETEFLYHGRKIKPKKGTVCLFPADFTYVHRGNSPSNEIKYILTGWFIDNIV